MTQDEVKAAVQQREDMESSHDRHNCPPKRRVLMDGSRVTPGTERCMCDSPEPRPDGWPRDCEFPCWQRLGITSAPCCPDCAPLDVAA